MKLDLWVLILTLVQFFIMSWMCTYHLIVMTIWMISYIICIKLTLYSRTTILFIIWLLDILILTCWGHLCSGGVVQILWWKMLHYRWSKHLPENTFTFHSDAHDTVSRLDHAICSTAMFNKITSMNVLYSYLTSDHFVLSVELDNVINEIPPDLCNDSDDTFNIKRVHWDRLTCDTLFEYTDLTN